MKRRGKEDYERGLELIDRADCCEKRGEGANVCYDTRVLLSKDISCNNNNNNNNGRVC